jgi:hypothetical protein
VLQPAAFLLRISESCDFPDVAGGGVEIPETSFLTQARAEAVPVPVLPVQGPNSYRLYIQNAVIDLLTILFESLEVGCCSVGRLLALLDMLPYDAGIFHFDSPKIPKLAF